MQFERTLKRCMSSAIAARQPDDAELGRHVIGLAEISDQRRGRGHVHGAPEFCSREMRERSSAAHVEGAVEVDVEHVLPVLAGSCGGRSRVAGAGIVDQDVDAAECIARGFHDRFGVRRFGDRERGGDRLATGLLDLIDHLLAAPASVPAPCRLAPTSQATTLAPAWASPSAMPRPMPRAAPVTIAAFPETMPAAINSPTWNPLRVPSRLRDGYSVCTDQRDFSRIRRSQSSSGRRRPRHQPEGL